VHHFMTESVAALRAHLEEYFQRHADRLLSLKPWGPDVRHRLQQYSQRGKLIRGALVPFAYRTCHPKDPSPEVCFGAGVAMELLQAFLLIHDDIMDQDSLRRGEPAIHTQYEHASPSKPDSGQYGVSMGICTGDVAAFLAMEQMSTLPVPAELGNEMTAEVAREIVLVGLAQMQDVHHGYIRETDTASILDVYTYKTGRYTFSLPLSLGSRLAGCSPDQIETMRKFGEHAGRIFQIRDDQLGLFGSSNEIGKSAGSDIREDKKTIFRNYLLQRIGDDHPVRGYFGSNEIGDPEIEKVRHAILDTGVLDEIDRMVSSEQAHAEHLIESLGLPDDGRAAMMALLQYNTTRSV
jgi:geranylgeranyl diphosphate synthase, type I